MIKAGIGLAAVAALGAYFLNGERGEKNRQMAAGWVLRMKSEVLKKVEGVKEINKEEYYRIVDEIAQRCAKLGKIGAAELEHLTKELKGAWAHLNKRLG